MIVETSTTNVLLSAIIALQCWIVRELFKLKARISLIATVCPKLKGSSEFDTDRITKQV